MKKYILIIASILLCALSLHAQDYDEFEEHHLEGSFNIGGTIPQGQFNKYSDNGFYGNARLIAHLNSFKALSGFTELSGSFFKHTTEDVILTDGIRVLDAVKKNSQYAIAWHLGMMLGSDSRNSFFRPKAGIAGGLYVFNTQTQLYEEQIFDDNLLAEDNQSQVRVGWRGIVGTDLFFTPKWGLTFEFSYDVVHNLHNTIEFVPEIGVTKVGQTAKFHNYSIGVILPIPFE